jgi:hypothetical protein
MGASNFSKENATAYFVVNGYNTEYKCSECEEYHSEKTDNCCDGATMEAVQNEWEFWQWDEYKESVSDYISDEIIKLNPENYVSNRSAKDDNSRSYGASGIVVVGRSFSYKNKKFDNAFDVEVEIEILLRSAYYQGANWDWNYKIHFPCSETDDIEYVRSTVKEDLVYYEGASELLAERYSILAEKKVQKVLDFLAADVEILLTNLSDVVLGVTARFSNGETIYHKVA